MAVSATTARLVGPELKTLTRLHPWRAWLTIGLQWAVILGCIVAARHLPWPATVLAIVVIATRQHALAVLMHDAAHYLLHRNRELNDTISDLFLAFPLLVSTSRYRRHHLLHHRHLNTEQDPDLENRTCPPSRRAWWLQLLGDLTGLNALKTFATLSAFGLLGPLFKKPGAPGGLPSAERVRAYLFFVVLAALVVGFGVWRELLLFWVLPMATVLSPILRLRAFAEHGTCEGDHAYNQARSVDAGPLERFLLAPCGVNYHAEHHLFPSVPFYKLPELSSTLRRDRDFAANSHRNDGYLLGRKTVLQDATRAMPGSGELPERLAQQL